MPHILIVDDDFELTKILVKRFEKAGWSAETAVGGIAALQRTEKGGIDLILSDIRMPDGTGIELLRKLRRKRLNGEVTPPIIIMTGLMDKGESHLKALGAFGVFMKFSPPEHLLAIANQAISTPLKTTKDY